MLKPRMKIDRDSKMHDRRLRFQISPWAKIGVMLSSSEASRIFAVRRRDPSATPQDDIVASLDSIRGCLQRGV